MVNSLKAGGGIVLPLETGPNLFSYHAWLPCYWLVSGHCKSNHEGLRNLMKTSSPSDSATRKGKKAGLKRRGEGPTIVDNSSQLFLFLPLGPLSSPRRVQALWERKVLRELRKAVFFHSARAVRLCCPKGFRRPSWASRASLLVVPNGLSWQGRLGSTGTGRKAWSLLEHQSIPCTLTSTSRKTLMTSGGAGNEQDDRKTHRNLQDYLGADMSYGTPRNYKARNLKKAKVSLRAIDTWFIMIYITPLNPSQHCYVPGNKGLYLPYSEKLRTIGQREHIILWIFTYQLSA